MRRRTFIQGAGAALAGIVAAPAVLAQGTWPQPGRAIRVIVPWPPGAANDALGRLLAQRLQEKLGATAVVENRVGGAGLVGTSAVIQAAPDGYTLLASAFNTAVMPLVLKGANFDPETDLEVVARTARAPLVLLMTAARPQQTLARGGGGREGQSAGLGDRDLVARLGRASRHHRVQPADRRRPAAGAVSRHDAGADRHHGRQCAAADRSELRAAAGGARRQGACARDRHGATLSARARCSDDGRGGPAGLRVRILVRRLGAEGHAGRDPPAHRRADAARPCATRRSPSG